MYLKTHALVLRETIYKESDKLLTLFTKEQGALTAQASGCRKKNSPLSAGCQQLIYGEFVLYQYRDRWKVKEVSIENEFRNIPKNMNQFSLACYFAQVCETITLENTPQPSLLSLILNSLYLLNENDTPLSKIKGVFNLRAACESGYEPLLDACAICQNPNPKSPLLAPLDGSIHCKSCNPHGLPLSLSTLQAMRFITEAHPKKIFSFSLDNPKELEALSQHYLLSQLEAHFHTLDYFHRYFS